MLSAVSTVFWGLITLSVLVFIHEGGHFLAARACGVRVTEFFLGLPCRFRLERQSRSCGTVFGVTPLLLGGYAAIAGMDPDVTPHAASVLGYVHRHGFAEVDRMAEELGLDVDDVLLSCGELLSMGSIAGTPANGELNDAAYLPMRYASVPRDRSGNTVLDGRAFMRAEASQQGEPWVSDMSDDQFLAHERSRTYQGVGFAKRAFMLLAGIVVNVFCGMLLLMSVYGIVGVQAVSDVNVLGSVEEGSPAWDSGLRAGDRVLAIGDTETTTWSDMLDAIALADPSGSIAFTYERSGERTTVSVQPDDDGMVGVGATLTTVRLAPWESLKVSWAYVVQTVQGVLRLLQPAHTMEVLDSSTSVVGISVMSAQAAAAGPAAYLSFAGLISLSLGFMNLLPIPPLDGGKLVIEAVQAVARRPVPVKIQNLVSYLGIALFGLMFFYILRADILRLL